MTDGNHADHNHGVTDMDQKIKSLLTELSEWLANGWLVLKDKRDDGVIEDFLQRIDTELTKPVNEPVTHDYHAQAEKLLLINRLVASLKEIQRLIGLTKKDPYSKTSTINTMEHVVESMLHAVECGKFSAKMQPGETYQEWTRRLVRGDYE